MTARTTSARRDTTMKHAHHPDHCNMTDKAKGPERHEGNHRPGHSHHGQGSHAPWITSAHATLHCLIGCVIGEVLGLIIGVSLGFSPAATITLTFVLAYFFGFLLGILPIMKREK